MAMKNFTARFAGLLMSVHYNTETGAISKREVFDATDRDSKIDMRSIERSDKDKLVEKINAAIALFEEKASKPVAKFGTVSTGKRKPAAKSKLSMLLAEAEVKALQKPSKIEAAWRKRNMITEHALDDTLISLNGYYYYDGETKDYTMDRHIKMFLTTHRIVSHAFTGGAPNNYSVIMEKK